MLVYGDDELTQDAWEKIARLDEAIALTWKMPPGIERHAALVATFIEAGELLQGVADHEFSEVGQDAPSAWQDHLTGVLIGIARAVGRSWETGFATLGASPAIVERLEAARPLAKHLLIRRPEGFAFYALYPECFFTAGRKFLGRGLSVVGLRSIGTTLAAAVAAGAGQDRFVTVRPTGDPFRRRVAVSEALASRILSDQEAAVGIVDEGPGLSGSSFGCIADEVEERGVSPERIHFFPSHGGEPGPEASERHRDRWRRAPRHVVSFDAAILETDVGPRRFERWFTDLVGSPAEPPLDLSGGTWRSLVYGSSREWPPAHVQQERRKFLLRTETGPWLVRFAGLGRYGADKLELAEQLASAGLVPPVAGLRHGFTVERWLERAVPLPCAIIDRRGLIEHVGCYLGFRAAHLRVSEAGGASPARLLEMARRNCALALGEQAAVGLSRWDAVLPRLERTSVRVRTDNRLHAWEWLVHSGRLLKTDALDHHAGHDLIGCQDIAWDIAGASVELELSREERDALCTIVERESRRLVDPQAVAFLTPCYLAFQLGWFSLAAYALSSMAGEAFRLRKAAERYKEGLRACLDPPDGSGSFHPDRSTLLRG